MRKTLIVANWKMHKTVAEAEDFMSRFPAAVADVSGIEMVICAPFIALSSLSSLIARTPLILGAQNMHWQKEGAYTGEISPLMLRELGVKYVIIGHSERRKYFGEDEPLIGKKVAAAFNFGLIPILCVGENLEQRNSNETEKTIGSQLQGALHELNIEESLLQKLVIAYEPVWAIGTGNPASGKDAAAVAAFLREQLREKFGAFSDKVRILYGGSVNERNITDFTREKEIDGALVGNSSLKEETFASLIKAVFNERRNSSA